MKNWNFDSNASIKFSGSNINGTFGNPKGTIVFDPSNLASASMDVLIETATIETGDRLKDKHAKGKDWFDVENYKTIKFTSSSFAKSGKVFTVNGTLQLHGTSKVVAIGFQFVSSKDKGTFTGSFKVNRVDFGIKGNIFGFMVGNEINVELKVPVKNSSRK